MIIKAPKQTDIPALRSLWKDTFGDTDAFLEIFFSTAFSTERSLCACIDSEAVGMLYWFDCTYEGKKIAYLYAVATHRDYRGRGICHALMDEVHRLLRELGYSGVILVPAKENLFDFYARLGYETCAHHTVIHSTAEDACIEMRSLSAQEYAELRRQLLPAGSVLQEGENIAFLHTVARFWAGKDFLLAVRNDEKELFGLELLGNVKLAPRITRALGFTKGCFRTVGEDAPFAMYRPLGEATTPAPTYFAFAFD